jgi:hypothetical protein
MATEKCGHIWNLWALYDEIVEGGSMLTKPTNSDVETPEFITAYSDCENSKQVQKTLLQRDDINYDEDCDEYISVSSTFFRICFDFLLTLCYNISVVGGSPTQHVRRRK